MLRFNKTHAFLLLLMLAALIWTTTLESTSIVKMNLTELVRNSGRIIVGTCIAIDEDRVLVGGSEIPFTRYTFAVSKSIKGNVGASFEIKHFGASASNFTRKVNSKIPGMPTYKIGEEFILILTKESKIGLSSPVGLAQGFFRVIANDMSGKKEVVNGLNNAGLFNNMSNDSKLSVKSLSLTESQVLTKNKGPIEFDTFISLLEKFVE